MTPEMEKLCLRLVHSAMLRYQAGNMPRAAAFHVKHPDYGRAGIYRKNVGGESVRTE